MTWKDPQQRLEITEIGKKHETDKLYTTYTKPEISKHPKKDTTKSAKNNQKYFRFKNNKNDQIWEGWKRQKLTTRD